MSERILYEWTGRWSRHRVITGHPTGTVSQEFMDKGALAPNDWRVSHNPYEDGAEIARLAAEVERLRAALVESREAMMEPHGEWKDVREAKAIVAARKALEEKP